MSKVNLDQREELGRGATSYVYRATERESDRVVALKKSRASLRVKRTLLQYEAGIMKRLAGHPAIPQVFAYGRVAHFELLAIELLHKCVADVVDDTGPLPVAAVLDIAAQLLSALAHVHGHGIIHRDIKPGNILFKAAGSWQVCLTDFGLAHRVPETVQMKLGNDDPAVGICGTLPYASLNAHRKMELTYRDDLESLGYTLISMLRGRLPWDHYTCHGTRLSRRRQVYEQKLRYDGCRLASGLPREFAEIIDYARSLSPQTMPNYQSWQLAFEARLQQTPDKMFAMPKCESRSEYPQPPQPVKVGEVVLARLLSALTIEGHSMEAGHEHSYVPDATLQTPEWSSAPPRPALVISSEWDTYWKLWSITVVSIRQCACESAAGCANLLTVPIAGPSDRGHSRGSQKTLITGNPAWPLDDSVFYVYRDPQVFCIPPSQAPMSAVWSTDASTASAIKDRMTQLHENLLGERASAEPDIRHNTRILDGYTRFYVGLSPLTPQHFESPRAQPTIDWTARRAWFDECVSAVRRRNMDDINYWTSALPSAGRDRLEYSNSYWLMDLELWDPQEERDRSLTLAMGYSESEGMRRDAVLATLDEIVAVEERFG